MVENAYFSTALPTEYAVIPFKIVSVSWVRNGPAHFETFFLYLVLWTFISYFDIKG